MLQAGSAINTSVPGIAASELKGVTIFTVAWLVPLVAIIRQIPPLPLNKPPTYAATKLNAPAVLVIRML